MTQHSPRTDTQPSPDDVGRRLSDPGDASRADTEDEVLAGFIKEYDAAADRAAVLQKYLARFPRFAGRIDSLARAHALAGAACSADPPPPRTLQPGDQLGDFTVVRLIASGGMGEVYEARQGRLNRTVAVKVIRRGRISPEARERFDREQQTLAKLHQTHIVPIHTSGEAGEVQFFAMAYIAGAALNRVVQTAYDRETAGPHGSTPALRELAASATPDAATLPSTTAAAHSHRDPDARFLLSPSYIRSVAELMVQAAEAVQHAHDAGVCHRDIKPSNLMVDRDGHCWIIDFGLAGHLTPEPGADTEPDTTALTHGAMGTPQYMAPEQYEERPEYRSDVWALGATLYELLTLRRAFDGPSREAITARVLGSDPRPVRDLVSTVPRDLAAICRKAMRKDPSDRYQSAAEFAADLRRWLNREPVTARPARLVRRVSLWSARNPGWAVAISFAVVAAVTVAVVGYSVVKADARAADARAAQERQRFVELRQQQEREQAVLEAQRLRTGERFDGWSRKALESLTAAGRIRPGSDLRDYTAALCVGLDADRVRRIDLAPETEGGASAVAAGPDGRSWLMAGWTHPQTRTRYPARLVTDLLVAPKLSRHGGTGPVAFRQDGTPLQVVPPTRDRQSLLLWDVAGDRALAEYPLQGTEPVDIETAALAADGSRLAAAMKQPLEDGAAVVVWDTREPVPVLRLNQPATALAFSADGGLLAVAQPDGEVDVWRLPDPGTARSGRPAAAALGGILGWLATGAHRVLTLSGGPRTVLALALGRNQHRTDRGRGTNRLPGWVLTAAGRGGEIAAWDLDTRELVNRYRGSRYDVHAVALSPDSTTLASAGRNEAKLWDLATGDLLLNLSYRNTMTGLAWSPDGRMIGVSSVTAHTYPGGLDVWNLTDGRGVRSFRGLCGQVAQVCVSPDGRRVAALSHNWEVGVWERGSGQLLHHFYAPTFRYVDNTGLVFTPDGNRLLFTAMEGARLWSVETGDLLAAWSLPRGLINRAAFDHTGRALLLRWEQTAQGKDALFYELVPQRPPARLHTIPGCELDIFSGELTPDGRYAIVDGKGGLDGRRRITMFDLATRERLWTIPSELDWRANEIRLSCDGRFAVTRTRDPYGYIGIDLPSGRFTGRTQPAFACGDLTAVKDNAPPGGVFVFSRASEDLLVRLDRDIMASTQPVFTERGRALIWGTDSGVVRVCALEQVHRQLTALGHGW